MTVITPNDADNTLRYEIVGYEEIPIDRIRINPDNPRPSFHLQDDDSGLIELGNSIRTSGQHRPAIVYEMVNGWRDECKDTHGHYMLLQGERRWRSSRIAKMDTLRCLIVRTPKSELEEHEWLGVEEAFKEDWQPFFVMRFAVNLAAQLGVGVTDPAVTARTGLSIAELTKAEKIMSLELPIQALVAEYEELLYQDKRARGANHNGRIGGKAGVRSKEFTPNKAAMVWDAFRLLRANYPHLCNDLTNLELQRRLAVKVSKSSTRDIDALLSALRERQPRQGMMTQIAEFLDNPQRKLHDTIRATGNGVAIRHRKLIASVERIDGSFVQLRAQIDQIGSDAQTLADDHVAILRLARHIDEYERALGIRIRELRDL